MQKNIHYILLLFFVFFSLDLTAQDSSRIIIKGKVTKEKQIGSPVIMVLNMRLGYGFATNNDGSFQIEAKKSDLIKIFCEGFQTVSFSFKDSVYKSIYIINISLKTLQVKLKQVTVNPTPEYEEVIDAKKQIGTFEYEPLVQSGFSAIKNPISALYQLFSKEEKEKREYVELLNQKAYTEAMKKILRYYSEAGYISLEEKDFDRFIDYCGLSRGFIKRATLYEVGVELDRCLESYNPKLPDLPDLD